MTGRLQRDSLFFFFLTCLEVGLKLVENKPQLTADDVGGTAERWVVDQK